MILERIHTVLDHLVRTYNIKCTYIHEYDPWLRILVDAVFIIHCTTNGLKGYSPGQLVFGRDMIILIKHTADWGSICQQKQAQFNEDSIHKYYK